MVNNSQTVPGLVLPQISSAPTTIGTPQYVQSAPDGRGKQGQVFTPPQGPGSTQTYNGQSFPSFGVPQTWGSPQPPNQPPAPVQYQDTMNRMAQQPLPGYSQPQPTLNTQMPSYLPQFAQQPPQMPAHVAPQLAPSAQPGLAPQHQRFGGGGYGDSGYNIASWDKGNGLMPGRTFAR